MAQRTIVTTELIDDLDGTKAAETVRFAIDRADYEIDLSRRNASAMRKLFAGYIKAGRAAETAAAAAESVVGDVEVGDSESAPTPRRARSRKPAAGKKQSRKRAASKGGRGRKAAADAAETTVTETAEGAEATVTESVIREWALAAGVPVSSRGRLSKAVRAQYEAGQAPE